MADQDRFNREMDDYIRSQRRKQKQAGSVDIAVDKEKASQKSGDIESGMIVEYDDGRSFWDKIVDFFHFEDEEEQEPVEYQEELSPHEKKKLADMEEAEVDAQNVEDEYKNIEEMDEELDVPEPGFLEKLASFLGFGEKVPEDDYKDIEEFNPEQFAEEESEKLMFEEDVKEVLKITHKWIERLPAKKKKEFKDSEDFDKYKTLLDKMDLLK